LVAHLKTPPILCLVTALLIQPQVDAEERLPVWEIGLGGGAIRIPDYRGSDEASVYPYPFVMPIYRGRYLQADEEGIKGILGETSRFRFDISLDGNVPVTNENDARRGMDDLDPVLQIGPMLRYKPWKSADQQRSLILDLPARAALALGNGVDYVGYAITPRISYRQRLDLPGGPWKWSTGISAFYGSDDLHEYYYQVDPVDATPWRPAYQADAGYGGWRAQTNLYRRDPKKLISLYALYDNVGGATFADSPLVRRDGGLTVGVLITWFFIQSKDLVEVKQWEWETP
jgi:outer membrane scaffolding protein for murein synthesis (MipA/OmpV family)